MINENSLEKESFYRRFTNMVPDIFRLPESIEIVYVAILTAVFMFFSTTFFADIEISITDITLLFIGHYGFPFEILRNVNATRIIQIQPKLKYLIPPPILGCSHGTVELIWSGLLLNLIFYVLLSFVIVRVVAKVKDEIYLRIHY